MNSKIWIRKALSTCLVIAISAMYSTTALASSGKVAGEILVIGKGAGGQSPSVMLNGEAVQSGRSIFTSATIATPDNAEAVLNLGKAGKIELAPNTTVFLSFDENNISGDLTAGRVTVLNSTNGVNVKALNGKIAELNSGESTDAAPNAAQTQDDGKGVSFLLYAIILGGAAAGIILAATSDNNRTVLGGGTTTVSTTR